MDPRITLNSWVMLVRKFSEADYSDKHKLSVHFNLIAKVDVGNNFLAFYEFNRD